MTLERTPLRREKTENDINHRGRDSERSHSSNFLLNSSSSSALFKLRNSTSPVKSNETSSSAISPSILDSQIQGATEEAQEHQIVDVLPSFEMYNALHRNIPRGNINPDQHDLPPTYQEIQEQRPALSEVRSGVVSEESVIRQDQDTGLGMAPGNSLVSLQSFGSVPSNIFSNGIQTLDTRYEAIIDDLDDSDNINVEKLYSLPKISSPVDVNIKLLKKATKPYEQKPEEESILKEYTSGDIINGYAVIENRSQQPLRFEMFYVTLEGCASVIDKKNGKRTVKRFLRMVDLSASWSYSNIDLATGFQIIPGDIDHDGCVLGLNNDRFLHPGVRYKKFFTFKFPAQLLDISCKHELFSHCLVPPSFGVDKYKNHSRYNGIKTNPLLGYGHLGTKGSPILTNDLVNDNLSISYTIDARVVGKDKKSNKLMIMREKEYNLRFIPFGFCQSLSGEGDSDKQIRELEKLITDRITALEIVFQRLEKGEKITAKDIHHSDLCGTIDDQTNIDSHEILERKLNQLHVANRIDPACASFPLRNVKNLKRSNDTVDSEFKYTIKSKSKPALRLKNSFLGGLYYNNDSTSAASHKLKCGIIMLECKIPKDGLPYIHPSLLQKTNKLENKNRHDQNNWQNLLYSLSDEEKNILDHLNIRLTCIQSNNGEPHAPPEIHSISTQLMCITCESISSIPVKMNAALLMNKEKITEIVRKFQKHFKKSVELGKSFMENIDAITKLYENARTTGSQQEIRFADFINNQLINDIESLASLKVDVKTLPSIFKKQEHIVLAVNENIHPIKSSPLSRTSSANGLSPFSSNPILHKDTSPPSSNATKQYLTREWIQSDANQYDREITVKLILGDDIKETLVPTFENCLCSRMYCVRVEIKFENNLGIASIDVPVRIRNLET